MNQTHAWIFTRISLVPVRTQVFHVRLCLLNITKTIISDRFHEENCSFEDLRKISSPKKTWSCEDRGRSSQEQIYHRIIRFCDTKCYIYLQSNCNLSFKWDFWFIRNRNYDIYYFYSITIILHNRETLFLYFHFLRILTSF